MSDRVRELCSGRRRTPRTCWRVHYRSSDHRWSVWSRCCSGCETCSSRSGRLPRCCQQNHRRRNRRQEHVSKHNSNTVYFNLQKSRVLLLKCCTAVQYIIIIIKFYIVWNIVGFQFTNRVGDLLWGHHVLMSWNIFIFFILILNFRLWNTQITFNILSTFCW